MLGILTMIIGILAAALHAVGFGVYLRQTKKEDSVPNFVTWGVWAFVALIGVFTFKAIAKDVVVTFQFFVSSAACLFIFSYALVKGKFSIPGKMELVCLLIGIGAAIAWKVFDHPVLANMLILLSVLISFIPTYLGVKNDPFKEGWLAWMIWTAAYLLTTINVVIKQEKLPVIVMPIILLAAHAGVWFLARKTRKARFAR